MSHNEHNHCGQGEHQGSCCCCGATCQCCQSHHHEENEHCDFSQSLLDLADEAWMEVLKEKIMKQIETHSDAQLEKLAALVSCTNAERWKNKMHAKHGCAEFKEKLKEIFSCGDSSCKKNDQSCSDKKNNQNNGK